MARNAVGQREGAADLAVDALWEDESVFAPRTAGEALDAYLTRAEAFLAGGVPEARERTKARAEELLDLDAVTLIREGREMRTAQIERAIGWDDEVGIDPPAPRGEGEPLLDYLERAGRFLVGDEVFDDDSGKLVRQARQERTMQLADALGERQGDR